MAVRLMPPWFVAFLLIGAAQAENIPPQLGQEYPKPGEETQFESFAREMNSLQEKLAKGTPLGRGFHRKAQGCLRGEFQVLASTPDNLRAGIFAKDPAKPDQERRFLSWARFSNAKGQEQKDTARELRGMAIKLVNAGGPGQSQDFLMTNGPVHFAHDAAGMMTFARASAGGIFSMLGYFITHPAAARIILHDSGKKVASLTQETYWSRVPILIGSQAVKFNIQPCAPDGAVRPDKPAPHYLTDDLRERARRGPLCFEFRVQRQLDPIRQPVEDAGVEWKESETPSLPVARLEFPVQGFESTPQLEFCEKLSMTPWHHLPAHRPIGNMNRARRLVYAASAKFRGGNVEPAEPDGREKFEDVFGTPAGSAGTLEAE